MLKVTSKVVHAAIEKLSIESDKLTLRDLLCEIEYAGYGFGTSEELAECAKLQKLRQMIGTYRDRTGRRLVVSGYTQLSLVGKG